MKRYAKLLILVLCFGFLSSTLAGCKKEQADEKDIYGDEFSVIAQEIAQTFPERFAYTDQENKTGDYIVAKLKEYGYDPEIQAFDNAGRSSRNIIVSIKGKGFNRAQESALDVAGNPDPKLVVGDFKSEVILVSHYDTQKEDKETPESIIFDGISDNASGTAALLGLAKHLKGLSFGYDVTIVFTGASSDDFKGATVFADSLTPERIKQVEMVYAIESIYAGDKLYAHAGRSFLGQEDRFSFRTALYLTVDTALSNTVPGSKTYGIDLRQNESNVKVTVPETDQKENFREFSLKNSDYIPFDRKGMKIVFIESGEYGLNLEDPVMDTVNSDFEMTDGQIRRTNFDSYSYLQSRLAENQLNMRINTVIHLLKSVIQRGVVTASTKE